MGVKKMLAAVIWLGWAAGASAAPNLVINGDFETGTFDGWTLSGNPAFNFISQVGGTHGFVWENGAVGTPAQISQVLPTVAGTSYTLSFDLLGSGGANEMIVSFGNLTPFAQTNFDYPTWQHFTIPGLVATGTSTLLTFSSRNDPATNLVDNITVALPAPEPETYALFLAGLGLIGALERRRHR